MKDSNIRERYYDPVSFVVVVITLATVLLVGAQLLQQLPADMTSVEFSCGMYGCGGPSTMQQWLMFGGGVVSMAILVMLQYTGVIEGARGGNSNQ